jgi:hypothetical protein
MIKTISLVLLAGFGIGTSTAAYAQMQQGYANDKPDVTVDRSVLQDLKNYQPPPMFGGDLMPPATNKVNGKPTTPDVQKSVEVTPVSNPTPKAIAAPSAPTLTTPNAEDLLNHPTQNFHVLTERNASMTVPTAPPLDNASGPLLPLPDDDTDPVIEHAKAMKAKAAKEAAKTNSKKSDVQKSEKKEPKKEAKKKDVTVEKKAEKKSEPAEKHLEKPATVKTEATKLIPANPNAYKPKTQQSMPAVPPIEVEKNILPPMSNSPLPSLPPTTDTTMPITKPTPGLRMMDAALERQMESDDTKIKEQLAETNVKTVKPGTEKIEAPSKASAQTSGGKTLIFTGNETNLSDKMMGQIKNLILPELIKDNKSRIQIISFATAPDKTESSARRISLSRALAVRDALKDLQIDTARMDVRALPSVGNSTPPDKVDIVLLK